MAGTIKCPKCGAEQLIGEFCIDCGLNFRQYAEQLKQQRAAQAAKTIQCPKCGQTVSYQPFCSSCGFDIKSYVLSRNAQSGGAGGAIPPASAGAEALRDIGDLFKAAWELYKKRFLTILAILLITGLAIVLAGGIMFGIGYGLYFAMPQHMIPVIVGVSAAGATLLLGLIFWSMAAYVIAASDETMGIKDSLGSGMRRLWAFAWLYSAVGYIVPGGFFLFIIPGVIFAVMFGFAQFVLAKEDVRGMNAVLKSSEYVRGHGFEVFLRLFIVWIISAVAGSIPFIGAFLSIAFMPFQVIYTYLIYTDLYNSKSGLPDFKPTTGKKFLWVGLATLGYLIFGIIAFFAIKAFVGGFLQNLQLTPPGIESQFNYDETAPQHEGQGEQTYPQAGHYEYHRLRGSWSASEVNGNTGWKFEFMDGNMVNISNPSGEWHLGEVGVRMDLGIDPETGNIKVPPGAGILDITIKGSSNNSYTNQIALGVYSFNGENMMTYCGSDPGMPMRPTAYTPGGGVRCFNLERDASDGQTQAAQPDSNEAFVKTSKQSYNVSEQVVAEYYNFPGNKQDWITLVAANAPENTYGQWFYTNGQTSGKYTFSGLAAGDYEIRAYFNWPSGGYNVMARHPFSVQDVQTGPQSARPSEPAQNAKQVFIYVYALNYKGVVRLNGKDVYVIKGEEGMNYNYNGFGELKPGVNVFEIEYSALEGKSMREIKLEVKEDRKLIGDWKITDQSGKKTFEITN